MPIERKTSPQQEKPLPTYFIFLNGGLSGLIKFFKLETNFFIKESFIICKS